MTDFDKSAVDVAELGGLELARVLQSLGLGPPEVCEKLTNGGCAANYKCRLLDGAECVLKACVGDDAEPLARSQLAVLQHLSTRGAKIAPALRSLRVAPCASTTGAQAAAIAMDVCPGEACNIMLREGRLGEVAACRALGAALAGVHATGAPPEGVFDVRDGYVERYVRCQAPLEAYWSSADDPTGFVEWVLADGRKRLNAARAAIADSELPAGLLHGDPYLDNVLYDVDSKKTTLVDWEDAAAGPWAFDLASAAVGCCFDAVDDETAHESVFPPPARPRLDLLAALLSAYADARGEFLEREAEAFAGLVACNALACALYRFYQFHVVQPDAPAAGKRAYREVHAVALALEDPKTAAEITKVAREVVKLAE